MTSYPAWTPASRPGIIPLHPLTFGTILGRSFTALRHNPKVLLGFALGIQAVTYIVVIVAIGAIAIGAFSRLDTLRPGTEEFDTVLAGSIALVVVAGIVLGLLAGAVGVIVQGVVVTEVARGAVAEKPTLGAIWAQLKPVVWRLIGYAFLLAAAGVLAVTFVVLILIAIGFAVLPVAIVMSVLAVLGAIPLVLWLSTKLMLAPSAIILEHATIRGAIVRSWTLIRGRFWVGLGVLVLVSLTFSVLAQLVSVPFSLLTSGVTTIISPTGDPEPGAIVALIFGLILTQVVTLLIQAVAVVVQSTASALVYIDCRMRREGLDLDLQSYVEQRDAGRTDLPDPYRLHVGRAIAPRPVAPAYPAYPGPQGYGPPPGYPAPQGYGPPPGYAAPPSSAAPSPAAAAPPAPVPPGPSSPPPPVLPTSWAAPGGGAPERDAP
ncbi:glycerophosphoryl diester phosphodiesterase membrane domain-containing protein [Microbacterium kunmingense]|uniref:glycerophosphoryl diester phosphodiesterase membrane domain-containing protein n=1 Tax=Microbacterium kunmingense TaxID=2915939 RepID=UPI003D73ED08